jgi:DNA-directed RNA polymerase subunit RPC12/RpoP
MPEFTVKKFQADGKCLKCKRKIHKGEKVVARRVETWDGHTTLRGYCRTCGYKALNEVRTALHRVEVAIYGQGGA